MDADVGDLAGPSDEVSVEGLPGGEGPASDGVARDVLDRALVLALGAGSVERTRARAGAPVLAEAAEIGRAHV